MAEPMLLQMPTDRMILEELERGQNLGANVAEAIDRHQKTVSSRLAQLEDYALVENIGNGVYRLTDRGEVALEHIDEYDRDDSDAFRQLVDREAPRD